MDEGKRSKVIHTPQLEDVPEELIHNIQLLLPVKEAARTCVLSKSWLHAWSTIPFLRFSKSLIDYDRKYTSLINCTLLRYLRDNTPMQSFDLCLSIKNQESASLGEKWIRTIASKTCLAELSLHIYPDNESFTFPDEIFSGKNLLERSLRGSISKFNFVWVYGNPVINCLSLQVLTLFYVHIIIVKRYFIAYCLLVAYLRKKNPLFYDTTIKIKNLHCLSKLNIHSTEENDILEIDDVPSLRSLSYRSSLVSQRKPLAINMDALGSVKSD